MVVGEVLDAVLVLREHAEQGLLEDELRAVDERRVTVVHPTVIARNRVFPIEQPVGKDDFSAIHGRIVLHAAGRLPAQEARVHHAPHLAQHTVTEVKGFGYLHIEVVARRVEVPPLMELRSRSRLQRAVEYHGRQPTPFAQDADAGRGIPREARLSFGLVFQAFHLFPQYTALENVTLAPELRIRGLCKKQKLSREQRTRMLKEETDKALELLGKVGLSDKRDFYPCQLSGGQQQRVSIARALALNPDVLCFDEPTSALDPEITGEVLKIIKELAAEDMTMIIVTHEMAFARDVSDKILFMDDGVVAAQGTSEEIFGSHENTRLQAFLTSFYNNHTETGAV